MKITSSQIKNKQGIFKGVVIDNVKVAELTVNGEQIAFDNKGSFNYSSFIPKKGIKLTIQATAAIKAFEDLLFNPDRPTRLRDLLIISNFSFLESFIFLRPYATFSSTFKCGKMA